MSPDTALPALPIPVSFSGPGKAALITFVSALTLFLLWGTLAPINSGAIAPGEIIPAGKTKTVQHLEGGIIRAIHVREGDRVTAGQALLQLDETETRAQLGIAETEEAAQAALLARLRAERDGTRLAPLRVANDSVANQWRLFEARRHALNKELEGLQNRITAARVELTGWETKGTHLDNLSNYAIEESKINQDLYEKNFIARPRLLQLESRKSETAASIAENQAEAARARQKIIDAEAAIAKLKGDWLNSVLEDLRRAQEAQMSAAERVRVTRDRLTRTGIAAPQAGTVNGLRYHTVGGVIPPGGTVMDVTPASDQLVVEAMLSPDDIDVVRPGLPARVRLTAYKARRYFSLKGTVKQISSDTFKDDKSGRSAYKVRVEILDSELTGVDRLALVPGMLAQVEIVTGERTALRYLLDPVIDSIYRAMKEK